MPILPNQSLILALVLFRGEKVQTGSSIFGGIFGDICDAADRISRAGNFPAAPIEPPDPGCPLTGVSRAESYIPERGSPAPSIGGPRRRGAL